MAEAVVSIALERLADVVQKQIQEEVNLVRGVKKEVDNLSSKLKTIRNVLDDAERRKYKDKTVHSWLNKLEDVSYDIDDVLDEWNYANRKLQIEGPEDFPSPRKTVCPFMPSSCLCFNKVATRRDIAKKIKGLKERLNVILNEKDEFNFVVNKPIDPRESTRVQSVSLVDVSDIHGRGDDKDLLVSKLKNEAVGQQQAGPLVFSIVGVGGIGKTTLAQLVYNDERMINYFELKIWVCVSDVFDEFRIAKAILESVNKESSNLKELESLLNCLKDSILGKRFFLVLDDVWTEDYTKWEPFKNSLNCGAPGSKILVTTRSERVARMMCTIEIHHLGQLSDTDSWLLMKHVAFHKRSEADYEELQEIGWKIANKCKGLPLAIKVLGSLLRFKDTKEEWESILNNEIWQLEEAEVDLFPHLLLSYNELSPTMKRCFSYSAFFPKDSVINVGDLIRMWMALGYLGSTGSTSNLELRGKEYFNNLRMRCFFQDIEEDSNSVCCKMHDIVHDFALFLRKSKRHDQDGKIEARTNASLVSQVEVYRGLFCKNNLPCEIFDFAKLARIFSLHRCSLQDVPGGLKKLIHLRYLELINGYRLPAELSPTICQLYNLQTLTLKECWLNDIPREIGNLIDLRHLDLNRNRLKKIPREIGNLIELRFLNLERNELIEIPKEIGNLIRLRHLNLSVNAYIEKLPETICNLCDLQTLNIIECFHLSKLPEGMERLVNLRHLHNALCSNLNQIPQGIEKLTGLRTLSLFNYAGRGWSKLGYLKELNQLRGYLELAIRLHDREDVDEARMARLANKIHIQDLEISFDMGRIREEGELVRNEALEALQPPPNLKCLKIFGYQGTKFPSWITSSYLNHLRHLEILECNIISTLPCLGKLPKLEELSVNGMKELKFAGREFLGIQGVDIKSWSGISFPKLKKLSFTRCPKWKEWEDITTHDEEEEDNNTAMKVMPCLMELKITGCGLAVLPRWLLRKKAFLDKWTVGGWVPPF
ncbi:putative disease resistance protein RGA4 [Sesamum alatum]|uniref:Disease resistance protein RGA4 n=1 Tax=Sesamum alatum TaxID=300844 RepID=A0AAE1YC71_9LAMI|nr:putative disease resistance protein RGA4 [Sesamum alatum]